MGNCCRKTRINPEQQSSKGVRVKTGGWKRRIAKRLGIAKHSARVDVVTTDESEESIKNKPPEENLTVSSADEIHDKTSTVALFYARSGATDINRLEPAVPTVSAVSSVPAESQDSLLTRRKDGPCFSSEESLYDELENTGDNIEVAIGCKQEREAVECSSYGYKPPSEGLRESNYGKANQLCEENAPQVDKSDNFLGKSRSLFDDENKEKSHFFASNEVDSNDEEDIQEEISEEIPEEILTEEGGEENGLKSLASQSSVVTGNVAMCSSATKHIKETKSIHVDSATAQKDLNEKESNISFGKADRNDKKSIPEQIPEKKPKGIPEEIPADEEKKENGLESLASQSSRDTGNVATYNNEADSAAKRIKEVKSKHADSAAAQKDPNEQETIVNFSKDDSSDKEAIPVEISYEIPEEIPTEEKKNENELESLASQICLITRNVAYDAAGSATKKVKSIKSIHVDSATTQKYLSEKESIVIFGKDDRYYNKSITGEISEEIPKENSEEIPANEEKKENNLDSLAPQSSIGTGNVAICNEVADSATKRITVIKNIHVDSATARKDLNEKKSIGSLGKDDCNGKKAIPKKIPEENLEEFPAQAGKKENCLESLASQSSRGTGNVAMCNDAADSVIQKIKEKKYIHGHVDSATAQKDLNEKESNISFGKADNSVKDVIPEEIQREIPKVFPVEIPEDEEKNVNDFKLLASQSSIGTRNDADENATKRIKDIKSIHVDSATGLKDLNDTKSRIVCFGKDDSKDKEFSIYQNLLSGNTHITGKSKDTSGIKSNQSGLDSESTKDSTSKSGSFGPSDITWTSDKTSVKLTKSSENQKTVVKEDLERKVSVASAKSLKTLKIHQDNSDCMLNIYVRSAGPDEDLKQIQVRATSQQVKDGAARMFVKTLQHVTKSATHFDPLKKQRNKTKQHIHRNSGLVSEDVPHKMNWTQKPGTASNAQLTQVPRFFEPSPKKQNVREKMGLKKLQKYKIKIQCREIERIKLGEDLFPGILPPKMQEKWNRKLAEKRDLN